MVLVAPSSFAWGLPAGGLWPRQFPGTASVRPPKLSASLPTVPSSPGAVKTKYARPRSQSISRSATAACHLQAGARRKDAVPTDFGGGVGAASPEGVEARGLRLP